MGKTVVTTVLMCAYLQLERLQERSRRRVSRRVEARAPCPLKAAAKDWLDVKKTTLAPKFVTIEE